MAGNNNNNNNNKNGDWMKQLWAEIMKPPKWMKEPPKDNNNKGHGGGKKVEADVSQRPKKRQPPPWWSWSDSDGVPQKRHKKKARRDSTPASRSSSVAPRKSGSKSDAAHQKDRTRPRSQERISRSDLGSAAPGAKSDHEAQIRRHGFNPAVLKAFKITPTKVEPFGPVLRLRTNKGLVALKKTYLTPANIKFLHRAFLHLEEKKFTRFAPFLLTAEGLPYARHAGDTYYATRWIRGQEVDFRSMPQLALTARTLADFHHASRGFEAGAFQPPAMFDLADRFADRRDELVQWKRKASLKQRPDEIDKIFLKHVDLYIGQANQSLAILKRPHVRSHLLFEEDDPVLCHLDLTPYNMIYTTSGQVALIDLDFCAFGPRTLDLAHLLRRGLQRQEWDEAVARNVLVNYNAVNRLTPPEYLMLHGLLLFPHRFWRIAYQHYDLGHDPNHLAYFQLTESEETHRTAFLEKFGKQVGRMV